MQDGFQATSQSSRRKGVRSAYVLPNRRPTHIVNTPTLIAHFVFWFSSDDAREDRWRQPFTASCATESYFVPDDSFEDQDPDPRLVMAAAINNWLKQFSGDSAQRRCTVPLFTNNADLYFAAANAERGLNGVEHPPAATSGKEASQSAPAACVSYERTLAFEGSIYGVQYELIADIYVEHYTLSFRLFPAATDDGAVERVADLSDDKRQTIEQHLETLKRAAHILKDLIVPESGELEKARDQPLPDGVSRFDECDRLGNAQLTLVYQNAWDAFFSLLEHGYPSGRFFDPGGKPEKDRLHQPVKTREANPILPGALAGVFKNLVIRPMPAEDQKKCQDEHEARKVGQDISLESDRSRVLRNVPAGILKDPNERTEIALEGFSAKDPSLARRHIRARVSEHLNHRSIFFGLLLGFRDQSRWIEDLRSGNSALSLMLDGLAVHGSTLGVHTSETETYPHNEVRHFVIYGGPSRQQLGRLVRGLHAVGEYRLLVLRGHNQISNASRKLLAVNDRLATAENLLRSGTEDDISAAQNELQRAVSMLNAVKFADQDGGLLTRLSRLDTNETHLARHLEILRISRLEGWRPYDEFITRSVLPHVTYLKAAQATLDDAERSIQRLDYGLLRRRTVNQSSQITALVTDIKTLTGSAKTQNNLVLALGALAASSGFLATGVPIWASTFTLNSPEEYPGWILSGASGLVTIGFILLLLGILGIISSGGRRGPSPHTERGD